MIIHEMEQGSDEWLKIRELKLTGSNATAIGNCGAGLKTYVSKIITDFISPKKSWKSEDMERGNELEPIARSKYEFEKGVDVIQVGFIEYNEFVGISPDGLVGDDGMIECKARNDEKHLNILMTGEVDSSTIWQMNMQMMVAERKWCDFISYNPNFKNSFFVKRFYPDTIKIQKLKLGIEEGVKMLKKILDEDIVKEEINFKKQNNENN